MKNKFRSYAYAAGGIGVWGNKKRKITEMPLAYTFGGGGGTDIYLIDDFSIYFEAGALLYFISMNGKAAEYFKSVGENIIKKMEYARASQDCIRTPP